MEVKASICNVWPRVNHANTRSNDLEQNGPSDEPQKSAGARKYVASCNFLLCRRIGSAEHSHANSEDFLENKYLTYLQENRITH